VPRETEANLERTVLPVFKDCRDHPDLRAILDHPAFLDTRDPLGSRETLVYQGRKDKEDIEVHLDPLVMLVPQVLLDLKGLKV